jgi:phosphate transport system permease protein
VALNPPARQETAADLERLMRRRWTRNPLEAVIVASLWACGLISVITTALIVFTLFEETVNFFEEIPFTDFMFGTDWQPLIPGSESYGIWEIVAGTVNVLFWSLLIALPLGLGSAIYLSEYADRRVRRVVKPALEALAGVPTVVYAYFALTFVTPNVLRPVFGNDLPIFNALSASIVMAVMILPTIASVSEDAMASVPQSLREAAYGLGTTRLEVAVKVVVPAALSGIIAAILLAMARVIGETMIVAVAAGSTPNLTMNPLAGIQTMTGYMLQVGLGDAARGTVDYNSLFAVAAVLFVFTFLTNIAAHVIVTRFREEYD